MAAGVFCVFADPVYRSKADAFLCSGVAEVASLVNGARAGRGQLHNDFDTWIFAAPLLVSCAWIWLLSVLCERRATQFVVIGIWINIGLGLDRTSSLSDTQ